MKTSIVAGVVSLGLVGVLRAQTTISTVPDWDGVNGFTSFGEPDTGYFGQTVTVPSDARLVSYSFRVDQLSVDPTQYRSQVYLWDALNSVAVGTPLYTSGSLNFDYTGTGFATVSFPLPGAGLDLTTGQVILLMFDGVTTGDSVGSSSSFGLVAPGTYGGGDGLLLNSLGGTATPTGNAWSPMGGDLAFSATFVFAPEPATWGAMGAGLVGCAWVLVRRSRRV